MTRESENGVSVIRLKDRTAMQPGAMAMEMPAEMHLWMLLSGANALRDVTAAPRQFLPNALR